MHICFVRKKASSPRPRNSFDQIAGDRGAAGRLLSLTRVCAALLQRLRARLAPTLGARRDRVSSPRTPAVPPRPRSRAASDVPPGAPERTSAEMRRDASRSDELLGVLEEP